MNIQAFLGLTAFFLEKDVDLQIICQVVLYFNY